MPCASLLFAVAIIGRAVPAANAMSVDASGNRVLLAVDRTQPMLYERDDGRWERIAFGRGYAFAEPTALLPNGLIVEGRLHTWSNGRISAEPTRSDGPFAKSDQAPIASGNLLFIRRSLSTLEGDLIDVAGKQPTLVAHIATGEATGTVDAFPLALSATRLAQLVQDPVEGCRVVIVERGAGDWKRHEVVRPAECRPPEDEPGSPEWRAVAIALDGERMAIGAEPFALRVGPGVVFLYRRHGTSWRLETRLTRPDVDIEGIPDGFAPHGFGHRVVLDGPRLYVGDGFGQPTDIGIRYVHNGVAIFLEHDGEWQLEQDYVHAERLARFGEEFQVRGKRLFVDAMDDGAVHVFERGDDGWHASGTIPPRENAAQEAAQPTE